MTPEQKLVRGGGCLRKPLVDAGFTQEELRKGNRCGWTVIGGQATIPRVECGSNRSPRLQG